jgi:hypothetical protein
LWPIVGLPCTDEPDYLAPMHRTVLCLCARLSYAYAPDCLVGMVVESNSMVWPWVRARWRLQLGVP